MIALPLIMAATVWTWALDQLVFVHALRRTQAKVARLSAEMGLRSAEIIPFPRSRSRHASPLLKLSQRVGGHGQRAMPRSRGIDRTSSRVDQR